MTVEEFLKIKKYIDEEIHGLSEDLALATKKKMINGAGFFIKEFEMMEKLFDEKVSNRVENIDFEREKRFIKEELDSVSDKILKDITESFYSKMDDKFNVVSGELKKQVDFLNKKIDDKKPDIVNKIVKEIIKEKPKIIKETLVKTETIGVDELRKDIENKFDNIKIPEVPNYGNLKKELEKYSADKISGMFSNMPNYRMLGMGLQGQIDNLPTKKETITNKRITKRVQVVASGTSISPNGDDYDCVTQTNVASTGTLTVNNPTGTPTDFQKLQIRVKATNAQTFSWGDSYSATTTISLPITCGAGKEIECGFEWNSIDSKWYLIAFVNII